MTTRPPHLTIAANNGDIGGGEVMLLRLAEQARNLGLDVHLVAPEHPGDLLAEGENRGFEVVGIAGRGRRAYLANLSVWDRRHRRGLLWCNGLVPGLATTGRADRVLHLHRVPQGVQWNLLRLARARTKLVVVPSEFLRRQIPGRATVLPNWTDDVPTAPQRALHEPVTIGFLGRHAPEKGLVVLFSAMAELERRSPGGYRLVLAGEPRFVSVQEQQQVEAALLPVSHLTTRLGWVDRDDFFAKVDVAAFPSVVEEAFGLVAAEAMAAGVPFAISDTGGLPEVAGPGYPWVVPTGDAVTLADALADISADPVARGRVVARSRRRWLELYSPTAGSRRLAELLAGLGLPVALDESSAASSEEER